MSERQPCVHILASRWHGTLYIGVTSDLVKRIWEHQNDAVDGFTKKYRFHTGVVRAACDDGVCNRSGEGPQGMAAILESGPHREAQSTRHDLYPELL